METIMNIGLNAFTKQENNFKNMELDLTRKTNRFKITLPVIKAVEEKGKRKIVGVASGTGVDKQDERMSPKAIRSMADSIKNKKIELRSEHDNSWDSRLGKINSLNVDNKNQLLIEAELDKTSKSNDLWYYLTRKSNPIKLGLSIGGEVLDYGLEYVKELRRKIKTYYEIKLFEVSVTQQPALPRTWLQAIAKSVDWNRDRIGEIEFLIKDFITKPFPNEHAARQNPPGKYIRFRRQNDKFGKGIHAIFGVTKDGKAEIQSIRFDVKKFTVAQANKWLKDHDYKKVNEPATGKSILDNLLTNLNEMTKKKSSLDAEDEKETSPEEAKPETEEKPKEEAPKEEPKEEPEEEPKEEETEDKEENEVEKLGEIAKKINEVLRNHENRISKLEDEEDEKKDEPEEKEKPKETPKDEPEEKEEDKEETKSLLKEILSKLNKPARRGIEVDKKITLGPEGKEEEKEETEEDEEEGKKKKAEEEWKKLRGSVQPHDWAKEHSRIMRKHGVRGF